jgi:hypothetical protein
MLQILGHKATHEVADLMKRYQTTCANSINTRNRSEAIFAGALC